MYNLPHYSKQQYSADKDTIKINVVLLDGTFITVVEHVNCLNYLKSLIEMVQKIN